MRGITLRLGVLIVVTLSALVASTAATGARPAADRSLDRAAPGVVKASVREGVRAARRASTTRGQRGTELGPQAALAPGEHPGFVWCGNDNFYVWPGQVATTYDYTLYRTYFVTSATGDFTDAQVIPDDFYFIQAGEDYYIYDITEGEIFYGPTHFADAWLDYATPGNTDYFLFYTEITHVDGGVAGTPEYVQLEALGPSEVGSSNACRP